MTRDDKKRFTHKRVELTLPDGSKLVGHLQGVRANGDAYLMLEDGRTRDFFPCVSIELAQLNCAECGTVVNRVFDGLCASCSRDLASRTPFRGTPCDGCGRPGAVRNPSSKKNEYFCVSCHGERGEKLMMTGGMSGLLATCAHLPLTDREHEFIRVRGTRYRCHRCHQDFWGSGATINVVGEAQGWKEKAGLS